jgi:hypothetical protein
MEEAGKPKRVYLTMEDVETTIFMTKTRMTHSCLLLPFFNEDISTESFVSLNEMSFGYELYVSNGL